VETVLAAILIFTLDQVVDTSNVHQVWAAAVSGAARHQVDIHKADTLHTFIKATQPLAQAELVVTLADIEVQMVALD
jgi:hypothetical protein